MTKAQIKQAHKWAESQTLVYHPYTNNWATQKNEKTRKFSKIQRVLAQFVYQFHLIGLNKYTKKDYVQQIEMMYWDGRKAIKDMTLKELYKEIDKIYELFGTEDMTFEELVEATIGD